jgi:hypothetical protein
MAELRQRAPPVRDAAHLRFIRSQPCIVAAQCAGPVQAHHVRTGTNGGTSLKPSDIWCVPVCNKHHREIHDNGQATFAAAHRLDLRSLAESYAASSSRRMEI